MDITGVWTGHRQVSHLQAQTPKNSYFQDLLGEKSITTYNSVKMHHTKKEGTKEKKKT